VNPFEQLISALAGSPKLRGARCRGHHALFDPQEGNEPDDIAAARHRQAIAVCTRCPALAACTAWVESLPADRRPSGVVAGKLLTAPKARKRVS